MITNQPVEFCYPPTVQIISDNQLNVIDIVNKKGMYLETKTKQGTLKCPNGSDVLIKPMFNNNNKEKRDELKLITRNGFCTNKCPHEHFSL